MTSRPFRVFCAGVMHESHSFSPVRTDLGFFGTSDGIQRGAEIIDAYRGTRSEPGAIIDLAQEQGWALVFPLFASATPAGPVTEEAFEHFSQVIVEALQREATVDGILLVLHGAMVVDHLPDAEGELLRRVRAVAGNAVPIAVTFDLHGNISDDIARHANIVCAYRTTPHIDQYETARRAGVLLQRAMEGDIAPTVSYAQRPMFDALDQGRTISGHGPMVEMVEMAKAAIGENPDVLDVAVLAGFDWSDKYWTGPSVLVTTDRRPDLGQRIAAQLIDYAWTTRGRKTICMLDLGEAMEIAAAPPTGPGPLLIGDYTDCPGGAGVGDNAALLQALVEARIPNAAFASIADPETVERCHAAGEGRTIRVALGGKLDATYSGRPLEADAKILKLSDGISYRTGPYFTGTQNSFGRSCLLDIGGVKAIVGTYPVQIDDRSQFRLFGIEPDDCNVVACKAINHFRADFEPASRKLIYVDVGGIVSWNFRQFDFRKVRRPLWPLDEFAHE